MRKVHVVQVYSALDFPREAGCILGATALSTLACAQPPTLDHVMGGRRFYVALNDGTEANTPAGEVSKDSSLTLIDSDTPTLRNIQTAGAGGATAKDMPGGRFIVVPQRRPREVQDRAGGIVCQLGQIAVIDAFRRQLVSQTPMLYGDGTCSTSRVGKPEAAATASCVGFNKDGSRMFVALGTLGGAQNAAATVDLTLVFDMSNPRQPRQLAPIRTAPRQASDIVMANGGKLAFIPNSVAGTVAVVDTQAMKVVQTIKTVASPHRLSAFRPTSGPSKPVGPATPATN